MQVSFAHLFHRAFIAATATALVCAWSSGAAAQSALPRLQKSGAATHLLVDSKPFIVLGGELHNSSASSPEFMQPVWERLVALNLNTVILPVTWQLLEPEEGRFDFSVLDEHLKQAQTRNKRLILLWFGAYKNAKSSYAPGWVRADQRRFARAEIRPAKPAAEWSPAPLSVFSEAVRAADARAFTRLTEHLRQTDVGHTVIALQVQNEVGLLGDSRDRSALADAAWEAPVPAKLLNYLERNRKQLQPSLAALWSRNGYRKSGSWAQVFGTDWQAEEILMAWAFASYIEEMTAAGKKHLPIPMFANAWLGPQKPEEIAGGYPSGGPVMRVYDVWKAAAPSLDWLSPDIYVDDFSGWASAYSRPDNPLLIPEAKFIVGNLFEALGSYNAIGFSPFGIEDGRLDNEVSEAYAVLSGMLVTLAKAQAERRVVGFAVKPGEARVVKLQDYTVTVRGQADAWRSAMLDLGVQIPDVKPPSRPQTEVQGWTATYSDQRTSGLIVMLAPDDFIVVGKAIDVKFSRAGGQPKGIEIDSVEEGRYLDDRWIPGRTLNGDELHTLLPPDKIGVTRIRLLRR